MCAPADTNLDHDFTVSNVQPSIQRYAFVYVDIVHLQVNDAVISQKHHFY